MSAMLWKVCDGEAYRKFLISQDMRFQMAMRQEMRDLAADRGLVLREKVIEVAKVDDRPKKKRIASNRDYLFVRTNAPSSFGGIWQRQKHEQIIQECADKNRVSREELVGQRRSKEMVSARFEAYYRMSEELGYSLAMIGKACGGKDHTSVLHGVRKFKARMLENEEAVAA